MKNDTQIEVLNKYREFFNNLLNSKIFKMKYFIFIFLPLLFCLERKHDDCIVVNLEFAFDNAKELLLSDFVENIEYVVLKKEGDPIDITQMNVYAVDNYLICFSQSMIYLFDRQTGEFIKVINDSGLLKNAGYFDYKIRKIITPNSSDELLEYDLSGKVTRKIVRPSIEFLTQNISATFFPAYFALIPTRIFLDDNTIVHYRNYGMGNVKERLLLADVNGNILNTFSNNNSFIPEPNTFSLSTHSVFYHYDGNTYFFENGVDTIFRVTKDQLLPYVHFQSGKYQLPYNIYQRYNQNNFFLTKIYETEKKLFFEIACNAKHNETPSSRSYFFGYYDKENGMVKIADADIDQFGKSIVNDIDNFSAVQLTGWTVNPEQNEMISFIGAGKLVEWMDNNPKKLPTHIQNFSTLKQSDNPVIIIAKLK